MTEREKKIAWLDLDELHFSRYESSSHCTLSFDVYPPFSNRYRALEESGAHPLSKMQAGLIAGLFY